MNLIGTILVVFTLAVSLTLLYFSIYPALLVYMLLPALFFTCSWSPVIALAGGVLALVLKPWRYQFGHPSLLQLGAVLAIVVGTVVLLWFGVPRTLAFAVSQDEFEAQVVEAQMQEQGITSLQQPLGIIFVEDYATDSRGGTYFRVSQVQDGIGPDMLSSGFVYQPNDKGTPYGAARYELVALDGDWYWFRVSNDY